MYVGRVGSFKTKILKQSMNHNRQINYSVAGPNNVAYLVLGLLSSYVGPNLL